MESKTYEEDFKMIRSAIDGAKNPMNQLGGFFKSYAIVNMITVVLYLIISLYQGFVREMYIGRMICFVYLAYYIFRMYKEEKSNTNHYYQAMLYIYGSVVVVIPVILWIAGIINWKYRDTLSRFVLLCYAYYWLYDISKMYKKRMIINERGYVTG